MNISRITNTSFTSAIPVKYMVRGSDGQFKKAESQKEAERCQIRTTKMLNSDPNAVDDKTRKFIDFYKAWDKEYKSRPVVTSHVPTNQIWHSYLITGQDAVKMNTYSDEIGVTMRKAKLETEGMPEKTAQKYLDDTLSAAKLRYARRAQGIITNRFSKLKDADGDNVCMIMYFDKVYGKRSGKVTDYKYHGARIMKSKIVVEHEAFLARQEAQEALLRQQREVDEAMAEYHNRPAGSNLGYEPINKDYMIPDEEEERFLEAGNKHFDFYEDLPDPVYEWDITREEL